MIFKSLIVPYQLPVERGKMTGWRKKHPRGRPRCKGAATNRLVQLILEIGNLGKKDSKNGMIKGYRFIFTNMYGLFDQMVRKLFQRFVDTNLDPIHQTMDQRTDTPGARFRHDFELRIAMP